MNELVSIVIPTYKRCEMLPRTLDSLFSQSYENLEIIVVDDNDPESEYRKKNLENLEPYLRRKGVVYLPHTHNMGGCAARNTGLEAAHGKYICFLDDDDIYFPDKLSKQVSFLESHPEYDIVYCARQVGSQIHSPSVTGDISYYLLSGDSIVITIMLMFRREAIGAVRWNTKLRRNQEAGFLLDLMNTNGTRLGRIPDVLCESCMADRSNALNPAGSEREYLNYLAEYRYVIDRLKQKDPGVRSRIYAHRYVGIVLSYLKAKQYQSGIAAFLRGCRIAPLQTPAYFVRYSIRRFTGRKRDYYQET